MWYDNFNNNCNLKSFLQAVVYSGKPTVIYVSSS